MKGSRSIALFGFYVLLFSGVLNAQQITARICGVVQLEDGSAAGNVSVEAFSPKLVGKATAVTGKNGVFRLVNLSPGTYKMVFALQGFQTIVLDNVSLVAEQTINLKIQIKPDNSDEISTNTGQGSLIDVKSTSMGTTLTKEVFAVLPKGRNIDGLVAVIPGAANEALLGGLSIDGSSGNENRYYINGQDNDSLFGGRAGALPVIDLYDEVQFKSSGYQAEYGGALGGVIHVMTRAGGNEFHGDVVGYYSGSALRGQERDSTILDPQQTVPTLRVFNYADRGQKMQDSRLEGGFGIGGSIIKDKLWFYINVLPVFRSTTQQAIYLKPLDSAHLPSTPFTDPAVLNLYEFNQTANDLNFQVKLSAQPLKDMRLAIGWVNNYSSWQGALPNRDGSSADSYDFGTLGYGKPNWSASANIDYSVGNNFSVNARIGYFFLGTTNKLDPAQANSHFDPQYYFVLGNTAIADVPESLRRPTGWISRSDQSMTYPFEKDQESNLSASLDLTYFLYLAGEHAFKAGIAYTRAAAQINTLWNGPQVRFYDWRQSTPTLPFRAYVIVRGGDPTLRYGSRVNPDFPHTGQYGEYGNAASKRLAVYLQDSWTIANRFTLNFGARIESEKVPGFNDDPKYGEYLGRNVFEFGLLDKFSPRLGFVCDVLGDSSLKVVVSYGIYYDVMDLDLSMFWFGGMRWVSDYYALYDPSKIFEIGKLKADGSRDFTMLSYRGSDNYRPQLWEERIDPNIKPMSQSELIFCIEKKLTDDISASLRGTWRNLLRTIEDLRLNDWSIWQTYYFIVNPGEGWALPHNQGGKNFDYVWPCPKDQRDYKALNFSIEKRMSNDWLAGCNVTLSRLYGNYSGTVSSDEAIANNGNGEFEGNVTYYFDDWWLPYTSAGSDANGNGTLSSGLLPTDRPVVAKAYGAYSFPFSLTVGGVFNFMSGTPKSTEFYVDLIPGYYPFGRNDLGRTPNLWFLNLYAEYSFKLGRNTLQFSVNVDNVTNNDTATWYYTCINNRSVDTYWDRIAPGGDFETLIKNGYDLFAMEGPWPQDMTHWTRDPRYDKPILYQAPISARLGVKFIF